MYPRVNRDFYLNSRLSKQTSGAAPHPSPTNWRDRVVKTYTNVYKKSYREQEVLARTHTHARTLPPLPFLAPPASLSFIGSRHANDASCRSTLIKVDNQLMRNKNSSPPAFIRS